MASRITAESILRKISEGHLECPICSCRFSDPRVLDCLHSFCLRCIQQLRPCIDQHRRELKLTVACPLCRHQTTTMKMDSLPANFTLRALVEEVGLMEQLLEGQRQQIKCQNCTEKQQAIAKCMDCDLLLCQECKWAHNRMSVMKSHGVFTLAQLESGEFIYKSKLREEIPKCEKHPGQNLCFYCNTCEQLICTSCTVLDHKSTEHSLAGIPEALDKCIQDITELVTIAEQKKPQLFIAWAQNKLDDVHRIMGEASCYEILELKPKLLDNLRELTEHQPEKLSHTLLFTDSEDPQLVTDTGSDSQKKLFERSEADMCTNGKTSAGPREASVTQTWKLKTEYADFYNVNSSLTDIAMYSSGETVALDSGQRELISITPMGAQFSATYRCLHKKYLKKPRCISVNRQDQLLVLDGSMVKIFYGQYQQHQFTTGKGPDNEPTCIAVDDDNQIAVGYQKSEEITLHTMDGSPIRKVSAPMMGTCLTVSRRRFIYTSSKNNKLLALDCNGAMLFSIDTVPGTIGFRSVCCDRDGSIYTAVQESLFSGSILHFSPYGEHKGCVIRDCNGPSGIAFSGSGQLLVAATDCIQIYHNA
ncbi:tripartite motif-containing protein 45-like [Acanthaster planci]|uniref:Tripartite motif-containing protein 45-like n=1 Tax=Acanthaster planci TaxID=133434 RepID=A0A8B7ZAH2_ACAPL|nr:tripartite motif-containing protein 45-like [Acanthaster planci]XP_022101963.1 tripartite motif-containing protein 45-like [Acanthaster planci]XP_022101964.1 tripartite motif-containing protein 45-like [Acanthaster planci]